VTDAPLDPVLADPPLGRSSTLYWGYESEFCQLEAERLSRGLWQPDGRVLCAFRPHIPIASNGRGVAFDPLDGTFGSHA